jgi:hypothetical protein
MTNKELNLLLLKTLPELKHKYEEEVNWQEGDDTGSHVVFGDVFTPYLEDMIRTKNESKVKIAFKFIEDVLSIKDKYCDEVIAFSVLEKLLDRQEHIKFSEKFMGIKTKQICLDVKKNLGL